MVKMSGDCALHTGLSVEWVQILSIYKQLQAYHCLAKLWGAALCCTCSNMLQPKS